MQILTGYKIKIVQVAWRAARGHVATRVARLFWAVSDISAIDTARSMLSVFRIIYRQLCITDMTFQL
jgi:hypothetical protein